MKQLLFKSIDIAPLAVFRIFFGFLLAAESFGSIATGWVKSVFIDTTIHFQHIGFQWLTPLPGNGMYFYYSVMGVLGILVMIGYKYKFSLGLFTLLWTGVFLMQKIAYNNHYYLLILVCLMLLFLPANKFASIDVKQHPELKKEYVPAWNNWVMVAMVAIMYFYATIAKFYPDWLNGNFIRILLSNREIQPEIFSNRYFHLFIAYMGIIYDGLIVFLLLNKRTRTIALIASLVFHLFNAIVLQIGIFPFFALSFALFFYPPDRIRSIFFKQKKSVSSLKLDYSNKNALLYFFVPFMLIQIALPLRHHFINSDILWTEEGHRLSWRMMLRSRSGITQYKVVDKATNITEIYPIYKVLNDKQLRFASAYADGIWQMAQHIKYENLKLGKDVAVYVDSKVSINQHPYKQFIDPSVDLASTEWNYFSTNTWILREEPIKD